MLVRSEMVNRDLNWRNIVGISGTVIFFIFIFNILLIYSYFYLEIYPELGLMCLMLEGTEPLCYVCLSVCLPVTPAVSGVRGADERQILNSVPTVVLCTSSINCHCKVWSYSKLSP